MTRAQYLDILAKYPDKAERTAAIEQMAVDALLRAQWNGAIGGYDWRFTDKRSIYPLKKGAE